MSPVEKRATLALSSLFMTRMLGLFMILPVFSVYGLRMQDATPLLVGVALGVYGLTQALLQIPFGLASDRFGRKPLIIFGLILFCLGSIIAALSESIYGVIFGRALQGAGAIASVIMALLSDLTRDEQRTKAMAVVGASIGVAFGLALVLGPLLSQHFGVAGLFWLIAGLALCGLAIIVWIVPTPKTRVVSRDQAPVIGQLSTIVGNPQLLRLDLGVFILHTSLTACFVALPLILVEELAVATSDHWKLYLPVTVISFVAMVPLMVVAERYRRVREVFVVAVMLLAMSLFSLWVYHGSVMQVALGLFGFFWAFNLLEAMLPSLVSKLSPPAAKGTAMGMFSASQFLGAFCGGVVGGYVMGLWGASAVFVGAGLLVLVWLVLAFTMRQPKFLQSYRVDLSMFKPVQYDAIFAQLLAVDGVEEGVIILEEGAAYLKVDKKALDRQKMEQVTSRLADECLA